MHDSVMKFVHRIVGGNKLSRLKALDVGSLDVNGSVRECFKGEYVGVDMREGKNVDVVCNAHDLVEKFGEESFDVVVCCEMLEHDDAFWLSLEQMGRVLKKGGYLILTTRGRTFPEHGFPHDYWRFMPQSGAVLGRIAGCNAKVEPDPGVEGIFVYGVKQ